MTWSAQSARSLPAVDSWTLQGSFGQRRFVGLTPMLTLGLAALFAAWSGTLPRRVLTAIVVLCGVLIWLTPAQRLFYAVIGLVTALYSLIGLNLGGFGAGMVLGIIGGALAIAWTPIRTPAA